MPIESRPRRLQGDEHVCHELAIVEDLGVVPAVPQDEERPGLAESRKGHEPLVPTHEGVERVDEDGAVPHGGQPPCDVAQHHVLVPVHVVPDLIPDEAQEGPHPLHGLPCLVDALVAVVGMRQLMDHQVEVADRDASERLVEGLVVADADVERLPRSHGGLEGDRNDVGGGVDGHRWVSTPFVAGRGTCGDAGVLASSASSVGARASSTGS